MRKKAEFKPDSAGASLLGRLYLTQRQRQRALKWFLFAMVCLVLLVLQDVIFSRVRPWGATMDLLPGALLLICVLQGAESGGTFVLAAAVTYYFSGSSPGAIVVLMLPVLGILAAAFRQSYLRKGVNSTILCAGLAVALYEMGIFAIGLLGGKTIPARLGVFAVTAALSAAVLPVLYPVMQAIGKIGGETWKD